MTGPLEVRFENHLVSSGLIPANSSGIVAVSGGIDSVVLLHLLGDVQERMNLKLGVAHFNHRLRGEESDDDERFVKGLAEKAGHPFFSQRLSDTPSDPGMSMEAYARRVRYRFLEEARSGERFRWIATGHQRDDQAETVLMRVIDGSGIRGLRGIGERLAHVVRPLLPFSREEIAEYAERESLPFRNDSSNLDRRIRRNYVRHEVIPAIHRMNPRFSSSVFRLTRNVKELEVFVDRYVDEKRRRVVKEEQGGVFTIRADRLGEEPMFVQKRLIENVVHGRRSEGQWRRSVWEQLEQFMRESTTGQIVSLPDGWRLLRDRDRLVLRRGVPEETGNSGTEVRFKAEDHISFSLGHHSFEMDVESRPAHFSDDSDQEYADFGLLSGRELTLRRWREGDRMRPLGLDGSKKVSDILVDEKVNRFEKERQYVLTAEDDIVWLCGIRLDSRYGIRDDTEQVARLRWRQYQGEVT